MKTNKYRTNTCGELTIDDLGKKVVLSGFVQTIRDHGGVMFLDNTPSKDFLNFEIKDGVYLNIE